jgi:hypothetical protein
MINISISNRELTVEEIKKEAVKHNLIILTKEDFLNQTPTASPDLKPTEVTKPAEDVKPVQTPPTSTKTNSAEKISVEIKSGMNSEDIADLLKEKGLIKDTKAFLKKLGETDKDDKLKVGSFEILKGSSYDNIISILTR